MFSSYGASICNCIAAVRNFVGERLACVAASIIKGTGDGGSLNIGDESMS